MFCFNFKEHFEMSNILYFWGRGVVVIITCKLLAWPLNWNIIWRSSLFFSMIIISTIVCRNYSSILFFLEDYVKITSFSVHFVKSWHSLNRLPVYDATLLNCPPVTMFRLSAMGWVGGTPRDTEIAGTCLRGGIGRTKSRRPH